jgi:6-phospho-beta-glucosidase
MKLSILGGGGFRTPYVWQALLADTGSPRIDEVWLYDTDPARLAVMTRLLAELAHDHPDAPRLRSGDDLDAALQGSDFVFSAIRVGGLRGRQADEHVALDLGLLGQETTGAGGIAYALRTVPVMIDIAHRIRELAPEAYLINFTNPAGIVTEAVQAVLGDRALGICDTPSELGRRIAALLGRDPERMLLDYAGLNHLGWLRRVLMDGVDVLPGLLADEERLAGLEEAAIFGTDRLRTLGMIPNEYLYYYQAPAEAVSKIISAPATRGDVLAETQSAFYAEAATADDLVPLWRRTVAEREAGYMAEAKGTTDHAATGSDGGEGLGYAGVALAVMRAISRNERALLVLNVRNRGSIPDLPADAVVEVPALVDANGAHPLSLDPLGPTELDLVQQIKTVERHAISAAITGSESEALAAFALHPLVGSPELARRLLTGYRNKIIEVDQVFRR